MREDQHDKVREIPSQLCSHRTTPSRAAPLIFDRHCDRQNGLHTHFAR